ATPSPDGGNAIAGTCPLDPPTPRTARTARSARCCCGRSRATPLPRSDERRSDERPLQDLDQIGAMGVRPDQHGALVAEIEFDQAILPRLKAARLAEV